MNRRDALKVGSGLAIGAWLGGCNGAGTITGPAADLVLPIIDVHCHLFNGSDLPTVRFIKIVILHHYPKQGIRTLDVRDADALDGLIALFSAIVGRTRAPAAAKEIAVLKGQAPAAALNRDAPANEAAVIDATAEFLALNQFAVAGDVSSNALRTVRNALVSAATGVAGAAVSGEGLSSSDARAIAEKAYRSNADLGTVLRWFALFTRYRYVLSEQLQADHARQGFPPLLLCPAAIDYDRWLGENVDASPLPLQVDVMGELARRPKGPAVHGYVAFDPLRQAYFAAGKFTEFDPLGLVQRAIRAEGFLGVKLYPPMGFKPIGNATAPCQLYPKWPLDDLEAAALDDPRTAACRPRPANGSVTLAGRIDRAMSDLFDLCLREEGCIITHASESNQSGEQYAKRADPAHWVPVFDRWPRLRVCLAHFGHFQHESAAAPAGATLPEASWEWTLGRYLKRSPDAPVFADISYLNEVAGADAATQRPYAQLFRRWLDEFDPQCRHLVFGTDWTMLGLDRSYQSYTKSVYEFFRDAVKLTPSQLEQLFSGNAGRFLGLREGDAARKRLLGFYDRYELPRSRLAPIGKA